MTSPWPHWRRQCHLIVGVVGLIVARQLSEVPENAMKMASGSCWSASAPSGSARARPALARSGPSLLVLVAAYGVIAWAVVTMLGRARHPTAV